MKEKNSIVTRTYESPCGTLMLGSFGDKLCLCDWQVEKYRNHVDNRLRRILYAGFMEGSSAVIDKAIAQLEEYFAGKRQEFDIPLLFVGTDFSRKKYGTNCLAYLLEKLFLTVKWHDKSKCPKPCELLQTQTEQIQYPYSHRATV